MSPNEVRQVLASLVQLQKSDQRILELREALESIPEKRNRLMERARAERLQVESARGALTADRTRRDMATLESATAAERILALKTKIPQIRSNDEYAAILKEIDGCERQKRALDDETLQLMERIEKNEGELPGLEQTLSSKESESNEEMGALESEEAGLRATLEEAVAERDRFAAAMDADLVSAYDRISAGRAGMAVAGVVDGRSCGGCHRAVRPQVIQQLKRFEKLMQCESCRRYLYIEAFMEAPAEAEGA